MKFRALLFFVICLLLSTTSQVNAQEDATKFWSKVRFGGGIGLSFGDGFFSGTLAPSAVYQFNDQFALGVGLNGTYNSLKNTYKSTISGGSVISLFNVIPELQLSAEFEELNVSRKYDSAFAIENENYWYPALFLGLGYRNQNFTLGVRYDVLYDANKSIYANAWMPFVRVFF